LLDALGTIVELEPPAPALRALLDERFGIQVSEQQAATAFGAEMRHYRSRMAQARDADRVAALRAECAEVLRGALPPSAQLRAIERRAMTELLLDSLRFRLFPDVLDAVLAARERGLRVVVTSNWDALLPEVLRKLGCLDLLDGVVTSAAVGASKPSAVIFRAALGVAGATPDESIHVGDSLADDVIGARAAGIEPILLARDGARAAGIEPFLLARDGGRASHGCTTIESLAALAALW
jgi:putative hydrolase of the HAD superfamily